MDFISDSLAETYVAVTSDQEHKSHPNKVMES